MKNKVILINYANANFRKSQLKNSKTGIEIGGFKMLFPIFQKI